MKPTDITKIRQLLKQALNLTENVSGRDLDPDVPCLIHQALAILPCPTCNGTGKKPQPCKTCFGTAVKRLRGSCLEGSVYETCPDCQPCPDCQSDKIPNINPAETISEYPESM